VGIAVVSVVASGGMVGKFSGASGVGVEDAHAVTKSKMKRKRFLNTKDTKDSKEKIKRFFLRGTW
jgi:hypothetical protein